MKPELNNVPAHQIGLTFKFNNPVNINNNGLNLGKLKLLTGKEGVLYSATSGLPGFQDLASSNKRGRGRIPSCLQAKIMSYWVKTSPVYLPSVKGVNGNFYPITPFTVSVGGTIRSDLGIHRDTNVPGSAGCIVLGLEDHWNNFEDQMQKLRLRGIMELPLMVF